MKITTGSSLSSQGNRLFGKVGGSPGAGRFKKLITPVSVEFFSLEGTRLGDKKSPERQIHDITGITVQALQGNPLSDFSVKGRLSWAVERKTRRKEDEAYSLLS
jgi:hypothetical protein